MFTLKASGSRWNPSQNKTVCKDTCHFAFTFQNLKGTMEIKIIANVAREK